MKKASVYIKVALPILLAFLVMYTLSLPAGLPSVADETKPPDKTEVKPPLEPPAEPPPEPPPPGGFGYKRPKIDLSHIKAELPVSETRTLMARGLSLPSRFDWRDPNGDGNFTDSKVTSVKSQGSCGSCYAFAGVGQIESRTLISTGTEFDFSENNAKECNFADTNCGGGNFIDIVNLFTQKGLVLESADPYNPTNVSCNSGAPHVKTVLDWRIISGESVPATEVLKQYIFDYGPVFASLYAGFQGFNGYDGSYTMYYAGTEEPNHAVMIVGWDNTLPNAGGTPGGWIVKNSWGTGWGANGYFTIACGSASIGWDAAFVHTLQDYDVGGGLMYYDEGGFTGAMVTDPPEDVRTIWGLCKFIPSTNTSVTRVEFWTTRKTDDVDIYLYDTFNGTAPTGLLAQKLDQSFNEAGYHSVALDSPVALTANNDVVVVVKFTSNTSEYAIAVDRELPIAAGRTFLSETGAAGSWEPASNWDCDVAIRLRTSSPPVADFTANPKSGNVPLTVNFTDQSTGLVTGWSWNFGDGTTSTEQNPTYQYTRAGTYTVSLTVTGPVGSDSETKNNYITVSAGALDRVEVSPSRAILKFGDTRQFTATAYDQYNNQISGLAFNWSVINGGGSVDASGLFTAGATGGTFNNTVQAQTSQGDNTRQGTASVVVGAGMTATATLEGGARPLAGMDIPLTLKLYDPGTTLDSGNILTASPLHTFTKDEGYITITNSNAVTRTITFEAKGLPLGNFHIVLITPHALINLKNGVGIVAEGISVNLGTLLEGNADESVQVAGADFSLLLNDYLQVPGGPKWNNGRCDFDRNGQVTSVDFSLMIDNYNKTSPQVVN